MSGRGRRFLIFTLQGDRYAVNVENLSEVMETPATFPIPRVSQAYLGVMNFHGAPVPILDLASFLSGARPTRSGRILVLNHKVGSLALRIDTVERIVSDIRGLEVQPDEGPLVRQSILFNKEKIPLLAVEMLMAELEEEVRTGHSKIRRNDATKAELQ